MPMTRKTFATGFAMLALNFNKDQTDELADLYFKATERKLTDEQWVQAVRTAVEQDEFFPPVARLLRYGQPPTDHTAALAMFEQVLECYSYNPQTGTTWRQEQVLRKLGRAAAEGFAAAGGPGAFGSMTDRDEPFVYRRFSDAYLAAVRHDSALALPAGGDDDVIGPAEAKELLGGGE